MKNKLIWLFTLVTFMSFANHSVTAANTASANGFQFRYLRVKNKWTQDVHIEEGFFRRRKADVHPGETLYWTMYFGIKRLHTTYGNGQQIYNCPNGDFDYMSVEIQASSWDKNTPVCKVLA